MITAKENGNMQKILIVDDDTEHAKIIKDLLEESKNPYEVTYVSNGLECLQLLDKLSTEKGALPNLIILDIMMPVMDGWETFHHLRKNSQYRRIPILFFSARKDFFAQKYGEFFGTDFIEKPYNVNDLFEKIKNIMNPC